LRAKLALWYMNWTTDPPLLPLFAKMKPSSRNHPLIMATEGDAYLADKNYVRAVEIYEDLLEGPDPSIDTILRLSLAHHLAGHVEKFDTYLHEYADRVNVDNDQTLNDWVDDGSDLCRLRKFVPAAGLLTQVLSLDPESPITELHRLLGYSYLNFRHPDQARSAFARYLELVPDDPEITHILKRDARLAGSGP
jgi:tetratricopeptide (TPR) repeat protein